MTTAAWRSAWVVLPCALVASPALAAGEGNAPSPADRAAAQDLFDEGRRLVAAGRYADACPKFARSQELDPGGGTLLNLAACEERVGHLALAWTEFNEALSLAVRDGRSDRESFAREAIARLEPQLSRARVEVDDASDEGLTIRVDGTPLERRVWGVPVPLDPGEHTLSAAAPDHAPFEARFTTARGDTKAVTVPRL